MSARDYHVMAIDFSPHNEAMQTDALLETGMRSGGDVNPDCCDSGPKRMAWFVAAVFGIGLLVFVFSNL